ncbi:MAG: hypothetical protein OHK0046_32760 [Anaerolineae bacterium]
MTRYALVVDDTPTNRDFLERLLTQAGFEVRGAGSGREALELCAALPELKLAVVDMKLPDMNGLSLTYALRKQYENAYIVVATMYDERSLMESVYAKGGNCFLVKPHGFMDLYRRLTTMDLRELCREDFMVIDQYGPRSFIPAST